MYHEIFLPGSGWDKMTVNSEANVIHAGALILSKLQNSFPPHPVIFLRRYRNPFVSSLLFCEEEEIKER